MRKREQILKYLLADYLSATLVWCLFFIYRVLFVNEGYFPPQPIFWVLMIAYPLGWLFLHYLSGYYNSPFRKSRLLELLTTALITLIGVFLLVFIMLLNDEVFSYKLYFRSTLVLFGLQFVFSYAFRLYITQAATKRIHGLRWGFNTLIIGTGKNAKSISEELAGMKQSLGYKVVGFLSIGEKCLIGKEQVLGLEEDLESILSENNIEEVILATDESLGDKVFPILSKLYRYDVEIKMLPSLYDILLGKVKVEVIHGTPLISISNNSMPYWQQNVKRVVDIIISSLVLLVFSPLYLFAAIRVRLDSKGRIIYTQERLGKYGKLFKMYKFRSMYANAENGEPLLASIDDIRVTPWGKIMRKYRIDEIPQFWNVLKGEMSIVGPRPERAFFATQIQEQAPYYTIIQKIKPGITSWGMVKYGYADSIQKMLERLKYDILYIENMSLLVDLKILIYTVKIVFKGRGI